MKEINSLEFLKKIEHSGLKYIRKTKPYDGKARQLIAETISAIVLSTDRRSENYYQIPENLDRYETFDILYKRNQPIAFATIQSWFFPQDCQRVLSRTCLASSFRRNDASIRNQLNLPTLYILPLQIQHLISKGAKAAFFSIENPRKRKYCVNLCKNMNSYFKKLGLPGNWSVLDGLYQTCPSDSQSCWQNILLYNYSHEYKLNLPSINTEEWLRLC